jgi:hypothetical protein
MTVFCDVAPCRLTDVSYVLIASIIGAVSARLHGAKSQKIVIFFPKFLI